MDQKLENSEVIENKNGIDLLSNFNEIDKLIVTFERSAFLDPDFMPECFLADRRHLELNTIKKDLSSHLKELKVELVELINHNYTDFIDLSTILVGTDKLINNLKQPLSIMRNEIEEVKKSYVEIINDLETKLNKRSELREKKACLQLYISINNSVKKVEELLKSSIDMDSDNNKIKVVDSKTMERIAIEYNQLQYFVERGKGLKFVSNIDWKIAKIKNSILSGLEEMLKTSLESLKNKEENSNSISSLLQCLRTYELIEKIEEVEEIIKNIIVKPYVEKVITKKALDFDPLAFSTFPKNSSEANPLTEMYNKLLNFIQVECSDVIQITNKKLSGSKFDILTNSFWAEISNKIVNEIPIIFSPGIPEIFQKNYNCTMDFILKFESLYQSKKAVEKFRSSQYYIEFMKHWQLPIYYQIRYRNIITIFDGYLIDNTKLKEELTSFQIENKDEILIETSKKLIESIKFCWSDQVYLYLLTHRFWKLTIQLIIKYIIWLKNYIEESEIQEQKIKRAASPILNKSMNTAAAFSASNSLKVSHSSSSINSMYQNIDNNDISILKPSVILYMNIINIIDKLRVTLQSIITTKMPDIQDIKSILNDDVESTLLKLNDMLPIIQENIVLILIRKCSDTIIKMIKNIPTIYRRTNKEAPTKPSLWISTIYQPLQIFLNLYSMIDQETKMKWTENITIYVTKKYKSCIVETLTAVRELEGNLKRLKKVKKGGGLISSASSLSIFGGSSNKDTSLSDEDKIRLQMDLDILQYGEELKNLGIDIVNNKEYQELTKTTQAMKE